MGKFRPKQGGGSSNALCTASAAEIMAGYQAITKDSPLPQIGTLSATGDAAEAYVVSGRTFYSNNFKNKRTGTMANRGTNQYAGGFGSGGDYVAFNGIPEGWYHKDYSDQGWAPEIRMKRDVFKSAVINYFGIASITNFSVAQYSSQTLLFTWANPSNGKMWSGVRIVGKQGGWPSGPEDGSVKWDSAAQWLTSGSLATGTWYFRAWNYVTVSSDRWYGGYSQASIYNSNVSGEATFTYSQSWTVPAAVRQIQYFVVGGGGGTCMNTSSVMGSGGGGGGYTTSGYADVTPGQIINVVIGGGGYGDSDGGTSSISGSNVWASADGGHKNDRTNGGSGGSGGGGGTVQKMGNGYPAAGGNGGSDGGNGNNGVSGSASTTVSQGGSGQGSSTRCPWDSIPYSGGGGGGGTPGTGTGGDGGGGAGGFITAETHDGTANTGGGAGGISHYNLSSSIECRASGGSGIVRIRW